MIKDKLAPALSNRKVNALQKEDALQTTDEFSPFYQKYFEPVYRYLYSRLGNTQDAEDLCSQTFVQAYQSFHSLRNPERFAPWLFKIARNKLNDFWRKQKPSLYLDEGLLQFSAPDPHSQAEISERLQKMAMLIHGLTEQEQELIRLRYLAELNFREISKILGKSESAVKKALYRLLAQLQNQMES
ncbi:MAG: sigma-70 family RNA polymerase sigma factor [Anaerolineaceae bacterium]|nr:sigma-70 family RNA polymerase sigma factor [Anaerolineaceae bacterium]